MGRLRLCFAFLLFCLAPFSRRPRLADGGGSYGILFVFCTLCVACGLYYLAELVEEYTSLAKRVLRDLILFVLVLHVLLAVFDDFPLPLIVLGLVSHATYFTLLKRFPTIVITDIKFIASCVLAVTSHLLWFRHFTSSDLYYPFAEILAFFLLCVWVVPFGFFVSLSANDTALPHVGSSENLRRTPSDSGLTSSGSGLLPGVDGKSSHSIIRRFFDWITGIVSGMVPERFSTHGNRKVF